MMHEAPLDYDALAAHLDRGWDLLERNDPHGARMSAEKVLEMDPECGEALTILGMIASLDGEEEEALELYSRAMDADPEDVPPMLYAAEIHAAMGHDDRALALVTDALDVAEEEDDYLDAALLQIELFMSMNRDREARRALSSMPDDVPFPDAQYHVRAGRIWLELEDVAMAKKHYERAVHMDATSADALYGLGLVHSESGDHADMVNAWQKVRELDEAAIPPLWALDRDRFEKVAQDAFDELPDEMQELLENVPIVLSDLPSKEQVDDGLDPRLLGVFSGVPLTKLERVGGADPSLTTIHLFQRNIERIARDRDEAEEEIRITLIHETAHFFGLDDDDLDERNLG